MNHYTCDIESVKVISRSVDLFRGTCLTFKCHLGIGKGFESYLLYVKVHEKHRDGLIHFYDEKASSLMRPWYRATSLVHPSVYTCNI